MIKKEETSIIIDNSVIDFTIGNHIKELIGNQQ